MILSIIGCLSLSNLLVNVYANEAEDINYGANTPLLNVR